MNLKNNELGYNKPNNNQNNGSYDDSIIKENIREISSQLAQNVKFPTPKKYGAKGDGVSDDTLAIINALENENCISISDGIYRVTGSIKINPRKNIKGDNTGTILIDSDGDFTVFEVTYLNEICGFNIKQTNNSWSGNLFEVSSRTLEGSDAPIYVNLRNKIHDLILMTNSDYGTFIEISAYKYSDVDDKQYTVFGMWNNKVYNIQHKGYLEFFCKTYCYKKSGTSENPWVTDNKFDNINGDYYGYGWFGSKNNDTRLNAEYYNYNINVSNSVVQCSTKSKNFAYLTGGNAQFINCIPYDWGDANTTKDKAFLLRYSDSMPQLTIDGTNATFDIENYESDDKDYIINQVVYDNNGVSRYTKTNSFPIGYIGGTTYPKYIRIAKFIPQEASYSCGFKLHLEASKSISSEYSLVYIKSSNLFEACYKNNGIWNPISFLYGFENEYMVVYIKLTTSSLPWFISYDTPPNGSASKSFMYLHCEYMDDNFDPSNLVEIIPQKSHIILPDSSRIDASAQFAGYLGYDSDKGLCGFGRKHYGFTYIPIIVSQEITTTNTVEKITINNFKWGIKPNILIQPLEQTTSVPYPSGMNAWSDTFTINNAEANKKYLIISIFNS